MITKPWKLLALTASLHVVAALVLERPDFYALAQVCAQLSIAAAIADRQTTIQINIGGHVEGKRQVLPGARYLHLVPAPEEER